MRRAEEMISLLKSIRFRGRDSGEYYVCSYNLLATNRPDAKE